MLVGTGNKEANHNREYDSESETTIRPSACSSRTKVFHGEDSSSSFFIDRGGESGLETEIISEGDVTSSYVMDFSSLRTQESEDEEDEDEGKV
jgi:hypothetical protein